MIFQNRKKKASSSAPLVGLFLFAAVWSIADLRGQEFRAELQGKVLDESGLPIPGAQVTVTNEETGFEMSMPTNDTGDYYLPKLPPGSYRLEVSVPGFKTSVHRAIQLQVAAKVRLDVSLRVGEIQEEVLVTGSAPMVNRVDAAVDQLVAEKQILSLPINGRNAYALLGLSADVQPGDPGRFGETLPRQIGLRSNFSISGTPQRTNEVLLDGVPNSVGKLVVYGPSPDTIKEFKVQTTFDAEYGYLLGGVVNAVVKSGTNGFHGSGWEFLRHDILRANDFFSNRVGLEKAPFRFNQFGSAVGGPIVRNRSFFFVSYEGIRERSPDTFIGTVPTAKQREGDFSETFGANGKLIRIFNPFTTRSVSAGFARSPFPNNRIPPNLIDPVGQALVHFYPLPNRPGNPVTGANNFVAAGPNRENYDTFLIRIDHQLAQSHRFFGRYSYAHPKSIPFNPYGNEANPNRFAEQKNHVLALDYTYAHSPYLLFDLRAGFSRFRNVAGPESRGFDLSRLHLPQSYIDQVRFQYFPRVDVTDAERLSDVSAGQDLADNGYSLHGNISRFTGKHKLKFGFDMRFNQGNQFLPGQAAGQFVFNRSFTQGPDPLTASTNAGHGLASLLLGTGGGSTDINEPRTVELFDTAFYVNDTWDITPRLSLNLGLRYENYRPLAERFDRFNRGFAFAVSSPLEAEAQANYAKTPIPELPVLNVRGGLLFAAVGGVPAGLTEPDNNNFAPRLGIAFALTDRSVFRIGYGVSYNRFESSIPRNQIRQFGFSESTPWIGTIDGVTPLNLASDPYPDGLIEPVGSSLGLLTAVGRGIRFFETSPRTPYIQSYQASLQHALTSDLLFEVAYIGNIAQRLIVNHELNALPAEFLELGSKLNARAPNPFFGLIGSGALSQRKTTVSRLLRPFPHFTSVVQSEHIGRSWYHSMRLKLEKRFSGGLSFLVSYRLSKLMEKIDFLNDSDSQLERVIGGTDSPHRLVVSGLWELPFGQRRPYGASIQNSVARTLISGWQFNWIATFNSGFPVGGFSGAVASGRSAKLEEPSVDRWFDTPVFAVQPPFTLRTLSSRLSDVRRDGLQNFDLSILKNTQINERVTVQFRAEFFNAFNTPLFGSPNTNVRSLLFGQVRNQANSPREIQFGLKIIF